MGQKTWIYAFAVITSAVSVAALGYHGVITKNDVGLALLALLGTFFGALFAFRLDEKKEAEKELKRRINALNRSLLVLGAQHNEIRVIRKEMQAYPNSMICAFQMSAVKPVDRLGLEQRIDDLDFLLESPDPNMLFKLHIGQLRFDQALEAVRIRVRNHVEVVQPEMEKHEIRGKFVNEDILRKMFGERVYETAVNYVETMAHHVDGSNESIPALAEELRTLAKQMFPRAKFIKFDLVDPPRQFDARKSIRRA